MPESSSKQRTDEYRTFVTFWGQVPSPQVNLHSIRRGDPNRAEPDFICATKDGTTLTFELCELADQEMKRQMQMLGLSYWSCLTSREAVRFRRLFRFMDFRLDTPPSNPKAVVCRVVAWLIQHNPGQILSAGATGSTIPYSYIPGLSRLQGAVHVSANEGRYVGPLFTVKAGGCLSSSGVEKAIRDKASNQYQLGGVPISPQLLLHYSLDPPFKEGHGWELEPEGLRSVWEPRFTDVWVFNEIAPQILSHFTRVNGQGST